LRAILDLEKKVRKVVYATKTKIRRGNYISNILLKIIELTDRLMRITDMLKANPQDSFLQHALALEYVKMGRDADARQVFENILTQEPGYIGSYYHLAKLLERTGEKDRAIEWYEKGMQAAKAAGDSHALGELRTACENLVD